MNNCLNPIYILQTRICIWWLFSTLWFFLKHMTKQSRQIFTHLPRRLRRNWYFTPLNTERIISFDIIFFLLKWQSNLYCQTENRSIVHLHQRIYLTFLRSHLSSSSWIICVADCRTAILCPIFPMGIWLTYNAPTRRSRQALQCRQVHQRGVKPPASRLAVQAFFPPYPTLSNKPLPRQLRRSTKPRTEVQLGLRSCWLSMTNKPTGKQTFKVGCSKIAPRDTPQAFHQQWHANISKTNHDNHPCQTLMFGYSPLSTWQYSLCFK